MIVTILAVSKRLNGVCIAGIGNHSKWVRPVKKEELMLEDIKVEGHGYITTGNNYEFHFSQAFPIQCQTENFLMLPGIQYKSQMPDDEKKRLFPSLCENALVINNPKDNIADILTSRKRSLMMLGPVWIEKAYFHNGEGRMKVPELTFSVSGTAIKGVQDRRNLQCTDLKFWAFAKSLLKQRNTDSITMDGTELKSLLHCYSIYLIVGLTKLHKGINWPMVIGIHTMPDYRQAIDYCNL